MGFSTCNPQFMRVIPSKPWPPQMKIRRQFVYLEHTKATKFFGSTNQLPYYAFFVDGHVLNQPKKS
jgi:hypothetical protein